MKTQLHKANERGVADHGWLKSFHSFSFAGYYNKERMGVGLLRVINDDTIAPGKGFGTHPHRNMEIISIPLSGSLKHKDTMGNEIVINDNEVQAMSAGTGISHSEYNASETDDVNLLQIWIITKKENIQPHYSQEKFDVSDRINNWQLLVSPDGRDHSVKIHQDAFISRCELDELESLEYKLENENHLVYIFLLNGDISLSDERLNTKDALVVFDISAFKVIANKKSDILVIEVPKVG